VHIEVLVSGCRLAELVEKGDAILFGKEPVKDYGFFGELLASLKVLIRMGPVSALGLILLQAFLWFLQETAQVSRCLKSAVMSGIPSQDCQAWMKLNIKSLRALWYIQSCMPTPSTHCTVNSPDSLLAAIAFSLPICVACR
jgi:hypothetical protein